MNDPLLPVLLILRYMHILGAIALMGGTIFMRFALRPVVVQLAPETKATVHEQVRSRWSKFVMLASALLLLSGITNFGLASRYEFERVFGMSYHMVVGIKFLLALPIFFIAALLSGRTNAAKRMQENAEFWLNLNLTLALVMVLMGGCLKFVQRTPKEEKQAQAAILRPAGQNATEKLPFLLSGE
jgi:uncharacterized membrane protein